MLALAVAASLAAPDFAAREADWRNGAVVYHAFVDRFAPSANLDAKRPLYASPRTLKTWSDLPVGGRQLPDQGVWSHELDFWGGDLPSLRAKLGHIVGLGADVLYLNPIHEAFTNHKYDATDWKRVAPEYGTQADLEALIADLHRDKRKLVLDGVFNHAGRANKLFQEGLNNPNSPYRSWFEIGSQYPLGYRAWAGVPNLPEVALENPAARDYLWRKPDSVVAHFLKMGVDGWRLDVAHEIGFEHLAELTQSAHEHKAGSLVIGEAWVYPSRWTKSMDALMNIFLGHLVVGFAKEEVSGRKMAAALDAMIADCGIEPLLKSWIVLANHDMPRLATRLPDPGLRKMAVALQFALPGSPMVYYGDEVGMVGGDDPAQRAPMRWDLVTDTNEDLAWHRKVAGIRAKSRALKIGDCRTLASDTLFAFVRTTEEALDTTIVVANPTSKPVTETLVVPVPTLLGYTQLRDELGGGSVRVAVGSIRPTVPPHSVQVYRIVEEPGRHDQYKRLRGG